MHLAQSFWGTWREQLGDDSSNTSSLWMHGGDHPVLCQDGIDYESLIPITLHCDGAQFYRDDENFVWSFGSAFGSSGFIKDVLLTKFPMAIIPERFMQDHAVSG